MKWCVIPPDSGLSQRLWHWAKVKRLVFFAGLPGTGKSLLVHQLSHLAVTLGRRVHLLQWDVARPVFEASPAGQRYPVVEGVTHVIIRKAVGLWARRALVQWHQHCAGAEHLLIGETPFIGHRFIELARVLPDAAEALLAAASCQFVIPVPSPQVRQHIERQRLRRSRQPLHEREREDAPPGVLEALWQELWRLAMAWGLTPPAAEVSRPYDPAVYQQVYAALLRHRHWQVLPMHAILPTATFSVYDYTAPVTCLVPTPAEATACIIAVERQYPTAEALQREMQQWYRV